MTSYLHHIYQSNQRTSKTNSQVLFDLQLPNIMTTDSNKHSTHNTYSWRHGCGAWGVWLNELLHCTVHNNISFGRARWRMAIKYTLLPHCRRVAFTPHSRLTSQIKYSIYKTKSRKSLKPKSLKFSHRNCFAKYQYTSDSWLSWLTATLIFVQLEILIL